MSSEKVSYVQTTNQSNCTNSKQSVPQYVGSGRKETPTIPLKGPGIIRPEPIPNSTHQPTLECPSIMREKKLSNHFPTVLLNTLQPFKDIAPPQHPPPSEHAPSRLTPNLMKPHRLVASSNDDAPFTFWPPTPASQPRNRISAHTYAGIFSQNIAIFSAVLNSSIIGQRGSADSRVIGASGVSNRIQSPHILLPGDLHDLSTFRPAEDRNSDWMVRVCVPECRCDFAVTCGPEERSHLGRDIDGGESCA